MAFQPTAEQQAALDLFTSGATLAIEAGAGTGKTSTLRMLAESTDRRGQYVAFNKAIVAEAQQKMPDTVKANTAHSLAFRAVGVRYRDRLNSGRMSGGQIARALDLEPLSVPTEDGSMKRLAPGFLAGVVMKAITRFCQTADPEPSGRHVPALPGLDAPGEWTNNDRVAAALAPAAQRAWADLMHPSGRLPFRHDHYLKAWQLEGPTIEADYILFDEAQDANPVMRAIVAAQDHAQLVWVGDSQQQIYGFTGAVNALAEVDADHRTFLSRSFRFGAAVADEANAILDRLDADLRLEGNPALQSTVGYIDSPDAILCRTNAAAVAYVLKRLAGGGRPHLIGGGSEVVRFARAARQLQDEGWTYHPELACFRSWDEVRAYVVEDQQGDELRLMVNLVDEFGVDAITEGLGNMPAERSADVVVSTAHKAKGREWPRVALASDYPTDPGKTSPEEWRLLYVAVTRAEQHLDVSRVPVLRADLEGLAA